LIKLEGRKRHRRSTFGPGEVSFYSDLERLVTETNKWRRDGSWSSGIPKSEYYEQLPKFNIPLKNPFETLLNDEILTTA